MAQQRLAIVCEVVAEQDEPVTIGEFDRVLRARYPDIHRDLFDNYRGKWSLYRQTFTQALEAGCVLRQRRKGTNAYYYFANPDHPVLG